MKYNSGPLTQSMTVNDTRRKTARNARRTLKRKKTIATNYGAGNVFNFERNFRQGTNKMQLGPLVEGIVFHEAYHPEHSK